MSYTINKSDNKTIVAEVSDSTIDIHSSDVTLVGRDYSGYGKVINDNFIKLLENFASTTPLHPMNGQLWFDSAERKLKVYNGTTFAPVSTASISPTMPDNLAMGDLWYNSSDKQLFFYDGVTTTLLGPAYTDNNRLSGIKVLTVADNKHNDQVVTCLYNNGRLLGLFASETFILDNPQAIPGYAGDIFIGFNPGNIDGFKFNATSSNSLKLGGVLAEIYVKTNTENLLEQQLRIANDTGLLVGVSGNAAISITTGNVIVANTIQNKSIILSVKNNTNAPESAITITPSTALVAGQVVVDPLYQVNTGSLTVAGNLRVEGETISVLTTNLVIEDINIVLAKQADVIPTDVNASGGGVILQGNNSHALLWADTNKAAIPNTATGYDNSIPSLIGNAWNSTADLNLISGKEYKIDGVTVLTSTSLGPTITTLPGVTSFGIQSTISVGVDSVISLSLTDSRITALENKNLILETTGDIELVGNPKITGLGWPYEPTDAASVAYVDNAVKQQPIALSLDLSDNQSDVYVLSLVSQLYPIYMYNAGTVIRVLCTHTTLSSNVVNMNPVVVTKTGLLAPDLTPVDVITSVANPVTEIPGSNIAITRTIKIIENVASTWTITATSLIS